MTLEPELTPELCGIQIKKILIKELFGVGLTESGEVYSWGHDYKGVLGTGIWASNTIRKPQKIAISDIISDIDCTHSNTFMLSQTGRIYWFGYWQHNQDIYSLTPEIVVNLDSHKIIAISCGCDFVIALTSEGKAFSWGHNGYGQLGLSHNNNVYIPQRIPMRNNIFIKKISCGDNHSLLLTSDGDIYSFGYNEDGRLGVGDQLNRSTPQLIQTEYKFNDIMAHLDTSYVIDQNGKIRNLRDLRELRDVYRNEEAYSQLLPKESDYIADRRRTLNLISDDNFIREPPKKRQQMSKDFDNPENSDFKFKVKMKGTDGFQYIYAHKCILEQNSEYFQTMFANPDWSENKTKEMVINDFSYEAYSQYIKCHYTNCIETENIEVLIELLSITEQYLNENIKSKCVKRIKPLITVQNVCTVYSSSMTYRSKELRKYCLQIMLENHEELRKSEDYKQIDSPNLRKLFRYLIKYLGYN